MVANGFYSNLSRLSLLHYNICLFLKDLEFFCTKFVLTVSAKFVLACVLIVENCNSLYYIYSFGEIITLRQDGIQDRLLTML